jgi:hypothetical protein
MTQCSTQRREELATLLTDLIDDTHNEALRLQAATLGLEIALQEGDPTAADITDSLVAGTPNCTSPRALGTLRHLAATAKAARRAIAFTAPLSAASPRAQIEQAIGDPEAVLKEIKDRIVMGQLQLAQSIVQVGLSRHPGNQALYEIRSELTSLVEQRKLSAPIPFPLGKILLPREAT